MNRFWREIFPNRVGLLILGVPYYHQRGGPRRAVRLRYNNPANQNL